MALAVSTEEEWGDVLQPDKSQKTGAVVMLAQHLPPCFPLQSTVYVLINCCACQEVSQKKTYCQESKKEEEEAKLVWKTSILHSCAWWYWGALFYFWIWIWTTAINIMHVTIFCGVKALNFFLFFAKISALTKNNNFPQKVTIYPQLVNISPEIIEILQNMLIYLLFIDCCQSYLCTFVSKSISHWFNYIKWLWSYFMQVHARQNIFWSRRDCRWHSPWRSRQPQPKQARPWSWQPQPKWMWRFENRRGTSLL